VPPTGPVPGPRLAVPKNLPAFISGIDPRFAGMALPVMVMAALALLPWLALRLDDPFLVRLFTRIVIFAIAAVALNFVLGFGGLASLFHASFMGIGGYVVGVLAHHDANETPLMLGPLAISGTSDLLITIPLAMICCVLLAFITGLVCLRTSGIYFIMITLAFNQMIFYYFVALERYGGEDGLQILSLLHFGPFAAPKGVAFYYVCWGALCTSLLLLRQIISSRFGIVLRAISQNERRAIALGVPALRYKIAAFAISAAVTSIAGALLATNQKFVSPADLSWIRSADLVIIVVLGGISLVWGPVIGAIAFFLAELLLSSWTIHWQLPFGILVILVGIFLKQGIISSGSPAAAWTRRRTRHG
jgi:branched-chain amino acid transport system permease protein